MKASHVIQHPTGTPTEDRRAEWFVPAFGPLKFRLLIGLLFLPYTGMVLAYTIMGTVLAEHIYWDRMAAIVVIYFLALGIGAHALDAIGSKGLKPWGYVFSERLLWILALSSIGIAYIIGMYYILRSTPLLSLVALAEGFVLFAYNLEWFEGRFHTDTWFAISWGGLPVLAGYVMQTNRISMAACFVAVAMGFFSLVEIKASRPYKTMKRESAKTGLDQKEQGHMRAFELILQNISFGVICLGLGLLLGRATGLLCAP